MSRAYLRVLEEAGPENVRQRYAIIFKGLDPVAAVAAQAVSASAVRMTKESRSKIVSSALHRMEQQILVCGNLLSWGFHGVAFAPEADRRTLWPAVAEALYRIRRADRLFGNTDLIIVKDVGEEDTGEAETLRRFSYRPLETEPNMILELPPAWRSYEDYLSGLTASYRKAARKIVAEVDGAGYSVEPLPRIDKHAATLHALYLQVHERQNVKVVTLSPEFMPRLQDALKDGFCCTIVRRDDKILGFVTTLRDRDTAVGYYLGFDSEANASIPLYFRLLHAVVTDGIRLGCRRISLGRTALEPKARLGARPRPLNLWVRHRLPALNLVLRNLLQTISHDEAPDRNPFK
jgi:hypothetical protein